MDTPPQTFKTRKAAHRWLQDEGVAVSQGKFYQDADRLRMIQPDKSVQLSDLLAYVKNQLKISPVSGQSLGEVDDDRTKAKADARKAVADADKAEMQAEAMRREMDKAWVPRDRADEECCVWVSRLRDAVDYHLGKQLLALIHACGGNPGRLSEAQAVLAEALAAAANEIANAEEITVVIEDLDDVG